MEKLVWLLLFTVGYWSYCIFWGIKGARQAKTASDYFIAGRGIGLWVFVLAATATSFSGWTFGRPPRHHLQRRLALRLCLLLRHHHPLHWGVVPQATMAFGPPFRLYHPGRNVQLLLSHRCDALPHRYRRSRIQRALPRHPAQGLGPAFQSPDDRHPAGGQLHRLCRRWGDYAFGHRLCLRSIWRVALGCLR